MSGYIDNYYAQTRSDTGCYPPPEGAIETETCVIGGGLAGINVAFELASKGRDVVLVEANQLAWGASGRNGGFVIPSYALGGHGLVDKVGKDHAQKLYALIKNGVKTVENRIREFDMKDVPIVHGMLNLSLHEDPDSMKSYCDYMNETFDLGLEYWDNASVRDALVTDRYKDAAFYPSAFHFHPLNYARNLACIAKSRGARICEKTRVLRVEDKGATKVAITPQGRVVAKNIVYACNDAIGDLSCALRHSIVPVATYVMVTEPLGDRLKDVIRVPYCILDTRFCNDYYRPLPDTRLLWGGRVSVFNPSSEKIARMMHQDMCKVFPQLRDVKVETAWGGLMGYPRHKMPQLGHLKPGMWYCTGFGGYGMATSAAMGAVMANAITGDSDEINLFKPFGLKFTGGPLIAPAVAQTMYWGYQAMDWLRFQKGRLAA